MTSALAPFKQPVLLRNNVRQRGDGARTLVFAHGFGCDQRCALGWHLRHEASLPQCAMPAIALPGPARPH